MRRYRRQIAALPLRLMDDGVEVLMITSRETRRWVVPKGWTMKSVKPWAAAAIEALEEAGAKGYVGHEHFGIYTYDKRLDDGSTVPCRVKVYPMIVERLKSDWKEKDQRMRKWFPVAEAAELVDEPELASLLRTLVRKPLRNPVAGPLLKRAGRQQTA